MKAWWRAMAIGVFALCMAVLVSRSPSARVLFDRRMLLAGLAAQGPLMLAWACIGWRLTLLLGRSPGRFPVVLKASLLAQGVDLLVPWKLSEFFKILYLHERGGCPLPAALAATALERLMDVMILALVSLATLALVATAQDPTVYAVILVAVPVALWTFLRCYPHLRRWAEFLPFPRLRAFVVHLLEVSGARVRDGSLARALVPGLLTWICGIGATWLYLALVMAGTGDLEITVFLALAVFWASSVGNLVSVLPAGFGTFETAAALVLAQSGIPFKEGLLIGVGLHLAHLAIGVLGAVLVAMLEPTGLRSALARARRLARPQG